MATTYQLYSGDGTNRNFAVPFPYLDKSHVRVLIDAVETGALVWLSASTVQLTTAPALGAVVRVARMTPTGIMPVDFTDGSILSETELDLISRYSAYVAEEARDVVTTAIVENNQNALDARGLRIANVAPGVDPTDAVNKGQNDAVLLLTLQLKELAEAGADTATTKAEEAAASALAAQTSGSSIALTEALSGPLGSSLVSGTWFGGILATISSLAGALGASLLGFIQAGIGAVVRSVQDKLRDTVSVTDFGAKCDWDGTTGTDDSAAIQLAINYCIANNVDLVVPALSKLSSPLNIDRQVDGAAFDNYFTIKGGGGFVVTTPMAMISSSIAFTTAPVSQLVYFDGLTFIGDGGASYVLNDGRFLRTRFHGCSFDKILGCLSTLGYSQSIQFTNCNIRRGVGTFWQSGSTVGYFSTDFHFDGNIVEAWTGDFLHVGAPLGCSITKNALEGISGTAILTDGSHGCFISANYFEGNGLNVDMTNAGSPNYANIGMTFTGNYDGTSGSTTYKVKWGTIGNGGATSGCVTGGNYFVSYMHNFAVNSHIDITGDVALGSVCNNQPTTNRGTTGWTPVDSSGAGLVFTGVVANYRIPGNNGFIEFDFEFTFPVTANAAYVNIGGLPFPSANTGSSTVIFALTSYNNYGKNLVANGGSASSSFNIYDLATGTLPLTNVQLSGKTLRFHGSYQAQV